LFSEPIALGTGTADSAGNFSSKAFIPATVPLGTHTLRVQGITNANDPFTLDVGVTVVTPAAALGANPKLTVKQINAKSARALHVSIRGAQRGCQVTFKAGKATAKARVSREGRATATISSPNALNKSQRVTARISGKGCVVLNISS
jgi:predicted RNA-binding protein with TRAM domain